MKLKTVVEAKEAIRHLTEKRFTNYKKVRELVKLRRAVETEFEFYSAEEKKAVDTYAEISDKGTPVFLSDGRLKLKDEDAKTAFESEITTLLDTDVDSIQTVELSEKDFRSADDIPTPDDMLALDGLVEFTD